MFSDFLGGKRVVYLNDRHEEADTEREGRLEVYDRRILPLLGVEDAAIFTDEPDAVLLDYYRQFGLAQILPENIFYIKKHTSFTSPTKALLQRDAILLELNKNNFDLLFPYIFSQSTEMLSKKVGLEPFCNYKLSESLNNKNIFKESLKKLGIKVTSGYESNHQTVKDNFLKLQRQGYRRIALKKERSVASFGVFVLDNWAGVEKCLKKNFLDDKQFILEGLVENTSFSPNCQFFINNKEISFLGISNQLIDNNTLNYQGNEHALSMKPEYRNQVKDIGYKVAKHLQATGFRGCFGLDFIISQSGEIYLVENNARINGSTFVLLLLKKLFGNNKDNVYWKYYTISLRPTSFEKFKSSYEKILFKPGAEQGVFPLAVDLLEKKGDAQVIFFANSQKGLEKLESELIK